MPVAGGLRTSLLCVGIFVSALRPAMAQPEKTTTSEQPAAETPAEVVPPTPTFRSAHAVITAFLEASRSQDWTRAATCLDYSELPADLTQATRNDLAFKLKETIDRTAVINPSNVSMDPDFHQPFLIPPGSASARIRIDRGEDGSWRFTADTVAAIEELYAAGKDRPKISDESRLARTFRSLSPALLRTSLLIPNYQWVCLVLLIPLGFIADQLTQLMLRHLTSAWFHFVGSTDRKTLQHQLWKPMGLLAQAVTWYAGTMLIGLPPMALTILLVGVKFFAIVAGVWTAFHAIDALAGQLARRAKRSSTLFDDLMVPMISRTLKVLTVTVGLLMCAETFNLPITGLIGGLGIGGAALAFASRDAISNFFGSMTVVADRPFDIGDWIITEGIEGSVEKVGFRSTRIRTFYNSQITLPNSRLTTAVVDNMGRRRYRRIKTMISLQYDTQPEQVEAFCEGVRELIRRHPYTRKDYYHVYLNQFGESSLQVLLYCFVECPDWAIELRERQRLFLDIMRLARTTGVTLAFPTRTLHLFNEQQSDEDLSFDSAAAESAGRRFAAEIAGPLLSTNERPGPVDFPGPDDNALAGGSESPDDGNS